PAETDYLFFVARGDGSHVFSRTWREHEKAKRRVNRGAR
ncbi:endolytic transglycosylase MltG, partial [candidate division WOR-3 bacterium]|nr:endolytic transglycosylase MltG [candidate division WOR-3 bacterium]